MIFRLRFTILMIVLVTHLVNDCHCDYKSLTNSIMDAILYKTIKDPEFLSLNESMQLKVLQAMSIILKKHFEKQRDKMTNNKSGE